ncbi:MAG: hypothetical protein AVDCRST_MAG19-3554 [uncultured Thermomicrobiales bacterium]|uniref:Uncharacterized protein n=1 Tax=uncultured Thermomicrobiales bacterium TaxID=1645740 RepID=A0A6J4VIZ3_9BACT|nr:MAG: hypothetical protein AVDCRST_MAG19-3554 [uncultured Thermomicrobiales bacterium]
MMTVRVRDRREHRSSPTTTVRRERSEDADEEEATMAGIGWQELVILLFILGVFLL